MTLAGGPGSLIFGTYAVVRRLAVGGMGEIFLARQMTAGRFERPVILKSLLPDLLEQEGSLEMFLDEARVASRLHHPNVVSLFEAGEWEGTFYIAMEYIEGENLGRLARGAMRSGAYVVLLKHVTATQAPVRIERFHRVLQRLAEASVGHEALLVGLTRFRRTDVDLPTRRSPPGPGSASSRAPGSPGRTTWWTWARRVRS